MNEIAKKTQERIIDILKNKEEEINSLAEKIGNQENLVAKAKKEMDEAVLEARGS